MSPQPISPSKGKARERSHWEAGWWDFQPLSERPNKPIDWSQSSIIFTAHPTQPLVSGRHFSSSKQFRLPSPPVIISSPKNYEPPSIISVAPDDEWLFAYFPSRGGDGASCLWKRGSQIDSWTVRECWSFAPGAGVVATSWLGQARVWTTDQSGVNTRLPPRGPPTPISNPTLLLVTQDHRVNVCYIHRTIFNIITSSLLQPGNTSEDNILNNKRCTRAAIGLHYNESSIIIATRSSSLPPPLVDVESQFNPTDITFSMDVSQEPSLEMQSMEWESWSEEPTINLCEVKFKFDGIQMSLTTSPLPPILHPSVGLVALDFLPVPPSPGISPNDDPSNNTNDEKGVLYLAATYLDFGNYTSTPLSELTLYTITRQPLTGPTGLNNHSWTYHKAATREFSPAILTFVASCPTLVNGSPVFFAGIANVLGALPTSSSKSREACIGTIEVLNLSDLTNNDDWEASPILSKLGDVGQGVPLKAVISPNCTMVCTATSSLWQTKTSVHLLPKRKHAMLSQETPTLPLSAALGAAIVSRRDAADITHLLSLPTTPLSEAVETLYQTIRVLDAQNFKLQFSTWGVLREALVVYRARAQHVKDDDNDLLKSRWKTAHDMFSLAACNQAFENCRKEDTYDLDPVWQLIGLSSWVVSFTEQFMKQCVLSYGISNKDAENGDAVVGSVSLLESPILLHLSHPLALHHFSSAIAHLTQFRGYLGSLSASGENAQIARDVLVDLVDNSGIEFSALLLLLSECLKDCQLLDTEEFRRALASCQPTPSMRSHLGNIISKLTDSTILNKSTLFIKPFELVDGVGRLSVSPKKDHDRDVVTKRILIGGPNSICLHCAGRSDIGKKAGHEGKHPDRWHVWEKNWALHCVCGGSWASNPTQISSI